MEQLYYQSESIQYVHACVLHLYISVYIHDFFLHDSIAKKFKLLERANMRSDYYLFTWKVFAGWDFAITSSKLAAAKKRQMGINFKETIEEVKKLEEGGIK